MTQFHTIYVPKKVSIDILIACFLLQKFGEMVYPGIEKSQIETVKELPESKDAWLLEDEGALSLSFKESSFPRGVGHSLSRQVAQKLEVEDNFIVHTFISIAEGRTNSETEGVARLLQNLIRQFAQRSHKTYWTVRPVLQSQMSSFEKQFAAIPEKYTTVFEAGKVDAEEIAYGKKKIRLVVVESNDTAMIHFLHTHEDILADVVCQKFTSGNIYIRARAESGIVLSEVVAALRVTEIEKKEKEVLHVTVNDLRVPGVVPGIEEWYYNARTQEIIHRHSSHDEKSALDLKDIKKSIKAALHGNKNDFLEIFSENQSGKLSEEERLRRESRLAELEGKIFSLKKKDIFFID